MTTRAHTILGLDLGSTFGWCLVTDGVVTHSGEVALSRKDAHPGDRFLRFQEFITDFRSVDEVCFENVPRFESAASARVYCGLRAVVEMHCLIHRIRMTCINANTVKKDFAGNGNCKKAEMCSTAHRLGWKNGAPGTDIANNECDAIATVWVLQKRRGNEVSFPQALAS